MRRFLVEWAALSTVQECRMVSKADMPSEVQAMCTVRGRRQRQGVCQGLSQDATGSRWQVLSVQRRDPNDEQKITAATDRHDFHRCRSEVRWRSDNKQGSDTIVTMVRIREAIVFKAKLADESTWLWFTSQQTGIPLRPTGGGEQEQRI